MPSVRSVPLGPGAVPRDPALPRTEGVPLGPGAVPRDPALPRTEGVPLGPGAVPRDPALPRTEGILPSIGPLACALQGVFGNLFHARPTDSNSRPKLLGYRLMTCSNSYDILNGHLNPKGRIA